MHGWLALGLNMADSNDCPSPDDLIRLKNDSDIEPGSKEKLQKHLAQCKNCQRILREELARLAKISNLASNPKSVDSSGFPPSKGGNSQKPEQKGESTSNPTPKEEKASGDTAKYDPAPPESDEPYPFLDPPEAEGEIGWVSNFRVFRVVGTGGMGVVFEAEDKDLRRRIALKVLRSDLGDATYRDRFLQEARLAGQLQNEHIVTIFRVGEWTGPDAKSVPFLAMEFLHGESLEARLTRDANMPVREALRVARQVAEGLWHAHQANLIHRDIKPANIWLEAHPTTGEFKRVKILDFGLAKPVNQESTLTHHGMVVGTPSYMAPEQIYGLPCDQRTDLFGLGCLLFKCLSGKTPFQGENTMAVLRATVEANSPDLHGASKSLPRDVVKLLDDLLAKDPDRRIPTAREVCNRIDEILGDGGGNRGAGVSQGFPTISTKGGSGGIKKRSFAVIASAGVILLAASYPILTLLLRQAPVGPEVKVGLIFSKTGLASAREKSVLEISKMAFKNLSKEGPLLGRRVVVVEKDGKSDPLESAKAAIELFETEKVVATFGCTTPASRRKVGEIVKDFHGLHFYPSVSEGVEEIPGLIHLGPVPNQVIDPVLEFSLRYPAKKGTFRKIVFVGMDEVGSRISAHVCRMLVEKTFSGTHQFGGTEFLPIKEPFAQIKAVAEKIHEIKPDMILTTVANQEAIGALMAAIRGTGLKTKDVPAFHLVLDEVVFALTQAKFPGVLEGDYAVANYFQTIKSNANKEFLKEVHKELGEGAPVSDTMVKAYTAIHLWAEAVKRANSFDKDQVAQALHDGKWESPAGLADILENDHTQYKMRIAQVRGKELVSIDESQALAPDIYPHYVPVGQRARDQQITAKDRWLTATRNLQTAFLENEKYSDWENRTNPIPLKIELSSWWNEIRPRN